MFKIYHIQQGEIALTFNYPSDWIVEALSDPFIKNPPQAHIGFRAPTFHLIRISLAVHQMEESVDSSDYVDKMMNGLLSSVKKEENLGSIMPFEYVVLREYSKRKLPCGEGQQLIHSYPIFPAYSHRLGVRYQDIVNCFEHSTYFANVSGHRELPQAVLA